MSTLGITPSISSAVPHLDQWFGYWHYEPQRAAALYDHLCRTDVLAHARQWQQANARPARASYEYAIVNGVAVLELGGTLMKHLSSVDNGTSTVMARQAVRQMANDDAVHAAIVVVDSPGGTVAGAYELADDIKALAAAKPTYGYAQDMACSAGYLQLTSCREISANRTALVGCIGTFAVLYDRSEMFKQDGVRPVLIGSGGFKGAGAPGTVITDAQVKEWQREVDHLNDAFIAAVAAGRKINRQQAAILGDGRSHVGEQARQIGLVDRVESLDALLARVRGQGGSNSQSSRQRQDSVAGDASAVTAWDAEIKRVADRNPKDDRRTVFRKAQQARPDLHRAYMTFINPGAAATGAFE